ncbi:MAG: hypothetical protein QW767_00355 [Thermoprotei archaeon]
MGALLIVVGALTHVFPLRFAPVQWIVDAIAVISSAVCFRKAPDLLWTLIALVFDFIVGGVGGGVGLAGAVVALIGGHI